MCYDLVAAFLDQLLAQSGAFIGKTAHGFVYFVACKHVGFLLTVSSDALNEPLNNLVQDVTGVLLIE
jgi:hypothetical protein